MSSGAQSVPSGRASENVRHVPSLVARFANTPDAEKLVFVMVGLPARGKSFISLRLARYLTWTGTETRVFNVGKHRRTTETGKQDASYFDPHDKSVLSRRDQLALEVLEDMMNWLDSGTDRNAIFDATNTTKARRQTLARNLRKYKESGIGVIFVESVCNDDAVLEANVKQKLCKSDDYASMAASEARADLVQRISHYETVYESIDETHFEIDAEKIPVSYIKLRNFSSHVVAHNIWGRASSVVLPFLMALHVGSRPVWLAQLPEENAEVDRSKAIINDTGAPVSTGCKRPFDAIAPNELSLLSPKGIEFVNSVAGFVRREARDTDIFTCTDPRGIELLQRLKSLGCESQRIRASLNAQDRGASSKLTAAEIETQHPEVWRDPLRARFPGGESLADVLQRLVPLLIEVEQSMRPVLLVAPLSVLQVLYCHYAALPISSAFGLDLPLHSVIEMRPDGGNFSERRLQLSELQGIAKNPLLQGPL